VRLVNRAEMSPVITQIEDIDELLTEFEAGQIKPALVENGVVGFGLWVSASDSGAVA